MSVNHVSRQGVVPESVRAIVVFLPLTVTDFIGAPWNEEGNLRRTWVSTPALYVDDCNRLLSALVRRKLRV